MTEAAMTDEPQSPYLRREPRSEAEAREDVLRAEAAAVRSGTKSRTDAVMDLLRRGWGYRDATDGLDDALREGGDRE